MTKAGKNLIEAAQEARKVAQCEHAFVLTPTRPRDRRFVRQFCPRCEGTFTMPINQQDTKDGHG